MIIKLRMGGGGLHPSLTRIGKLTGVFILLVILSLRFSQVRQVEG